MNSSKKPVALITGSTRGIGRGIALRLVHEGFSVVVNGIQPLDATNVGHGAQEVLEAIRRLGGEALFIKADISSASDRNALLASVSDRYERLDLLVNNAGIEPEPFELLDSSEQRFNQVMAVNLAGPFFLTQQAAKMMIAALQSGSIPKGRICFITSVQAYMATRGAEYCLTKAALSMAAKVFADRLGEHDIPVIEISPGVIHSDMADKHRESIDKAIARGRLITSRWGSPEDVAKVVAAFARGDLDYSSGERIEVGGGLGVLRF